MDSLPDHHRSDNSDQSQLQASSISELRDWLTKALSEARHLRDHGKPVKRDLSPAAVRSLFAAEYRRFLIKTQLRRSDYWQKRRTRWDGGSYRGKRYRAIWPKLAEFIGSTGIPPVTFVRWRFNQFSRTPPRPDDLFFSADEEEMPAHEKEDFWLFDEQKGRVMRALNMDAKPYLKYELIDAKRKSQMLWWHDDRNYSNLFEFCVATLQGDRNKASKYQLRAMEHMLEAPEAYEVVWAPLLPPGFFKETMFAYGADLWC